MTSPPRKPIVPAEATQELRAAEVLDVLGADESGGARQSVTSQSSIAPVGLDLARGMGRREDEPVTAAEVLPPPPRRRHLGKIVAGAVGFCGLILVAALIARVSHASSESSETVASASAVATADPPPIPASTATAPSTAPGALDPSSTGTVRLDKPARPGAVWLDGKKVAGDSVQVSCGTHQIRVGRYGRKHSIDVPCGGVIGVAR